MGTVPGCMSIDGERWYEDKDSAHDIPEGGSHVETLYEFEFDQKYNETYPRPYYIPRVGVN